VVVYYKGGKISSTISGPNGYWEMLIAEVGIDLYYSFINGIETEGGSTSGTLNAESNDAGTSVISTSPLDTITVRAYEGKTEIPLDSWMVTIYSAETNYNVTKSSTLENPITFKIISGSVKYGYFISGKLGSSKGIGRAGVEFDSLNLYIDLEEVQEKELPNGTVVNLTSEEESYYLNWTQNYSPTRLKINELFPNLSDLDYINMTKYDIENQVYNNRF
jgi:hypothetical protein